MSGIMCALIASGGLTANEMLVTVGTQTGGSATSYGYSTASFGSLTPTTIPLFSGSTFSAVYWLSVLVSGTLTKSLIINLSGNQTGVSWTQVQIGTTVYTRASASITSSGGHTTFEWTPNATNPFGTTVGAGVLVAFS